MKVQLDLETITSGDAIVLCHKLMHKFHFAGTILTEDDIIYELETRKKSYSEEELDELINKVRATDVWQNTTHMLNALSVSFVMSAVDEVLNADDGSELEPYFDDKEPF